MCFYRVLSCRVLWIVVLALNLNFQQVFAEQEEPALRSQFEQIHAKLCESSLRVEPKLQVDIGLPIERQPEVLEALIREVNGDEQGKDLIPSGFDYDADRARAAKYQGTLGPQMMRDALPEGCTFIDHILRDPMEPGVVKTYHGEFVSLRANWEYNGQPTGTNVGLRRSTLYDNSIGRPVKSMVSENAKAVVLMLHGGGTMTTGFHVAGMMLNHFASYGVDVVSLDLPWHGEGPKENFSSKREFFEWLRSFAKKYLAVSGKKLFLAGHSMGGQIADMYMREYPHDDLFSGVIPLSAVPDMHPGESIEAKIKGANDVNNSTVDPELRKRVNDGDLAFGKTLFVQNKTATLPAWFEGLLSHSNDWSMPADKGASYLPALYVWGEHDWLWVGKENIIKNYLRPLRNVQIFTMDTVPDHKGRPYAVGHMIFDLEGSPVFEQMRLFISKIIKDPLEVLKGPEKRTSNLLETMMQAYADSLAFRKFLDSQVVRRRKTKAGQDIRSIQKNLETLERLAKTDAAKADPALKGEISAQAQNWRGVLSGTGVPAGPEGNRGRELEQEIEAQQRLGDINAKKREQLKSQLETLGVRGEEHKRTLNAILKMTKATGEERQEIRAGLNKAMNEKGADRYHLLFLRHTLDLVESNAKIAALRQPLDETLQKMMEAHQAFNLQCDDYYLKGLVEGNGVISAENLPVSEAFKAASTEAGTRQRDYKLNAEKTFDEQVTQLIGEGDLGDMAKVVAKEWNALNDESKALKRELEEEITQGLLSEERIALMRFELIKRYNYGLYDVEEIPLCEILKRSYRTKSENEAGDESILKAAWQRWGVIYRQLPPTKESSWY